MSRSRTLGWTSLVVVIALAGGYAFWQHGTKEHHNADRADAAKGRPVPVKIATVEKSNFPIYLSGLGTVQGFNTVVVRTRVDGQIDRIAFKEGQLVKTGDLLAHIDPRPFQAALDQAKAKKAQDEASLANANLDLQRYTKLGEFATRKQTDTQRSTVQQLTAQIAEDEAAVANAQTQLDYTSIRAPITGVTGFRQVDQGNIVNASTQTGIVTIAQIEPIAVIFTAPEEQLPQIKDAIAAGSPKTIASSTDGKRVLSEGTLTLINNQVDTTSGTIRLKAVFENKDHVLWPGQSVSTRLLVSTLKGCRRRSRRRRQAWNRRALCLCRQTGQQGRASQAQGRQIDRRPNRHRGRADPGEHVIVAGQYRVQPGSVVTTTVADSEPSDGKTADKAD